MLPVCDSCGRTFFFPRRWCPGCWSAETSWVQATGRGTIYSTCMVNIPFDGRSAEEIPYAVALIDLEEGVRLPGRLARPNAAGVGGAVAIHFGDDPGSTLPVWVPLDDRDG